MLSEVQDSGDTEGFGIAIIEGNSMGLPAIGSLGCGIEDAIKMGYSGMHVDNHDTVGIAQAIETIFSHYNQYADNAQSWSKQHTWEEIIKRYITVLEEELKHY